MESYTAMQIAEYTINKCTRDGKYISNLSLQKILYYIQIHFLKKDKNPIFTDDIEAWQFGPVVPKVYYRYCGFGSSPILLSYPDLILDNEVKNDLNEIIEEKREINPWKLVDDTHKENGPWETVYEKGCHNVIPLDIMLKLG